LRIWLKRWRIKLKPCAPLVKVTDGSYEPDSSSKPLRGRKKHPHLKVLFENGAAFADIEYGFGVYIKIMMADDFPQALYFLPVYFGIFG